MRERFVAFVAPHTPWSGYHSHCILNQRARFRSRGLGPRPVSGGVYSLQAQSKPSARIGAEGVCIRCKRKANHRLESVLRGCVFAASAKQTIGSNTGCGGGFFLQKQK